MGRFDFVMGRFAVGPGGAASPLPDSLLHGQRGRCPSLLFSFYADGVRVEFRGGLHDPQLDGGGNLVYWYDADSQSAALTEQEKPKGPTEADVQRLADEIKSLARPPTMTEVRDLAMKLYGRYAGRPVFELLKADWKKFGLDVVKGDTLAQKLIVPIEG